MSRNFSTPFSPAMTSFQEKLRVNLLLLVVFLKVKNVQKSFVDYIFSQGSRNVSKKCKINNDAFVATTPSLTLVDNYKEIFLSICSI